MNFNSHRRALGQIQFVNLLLSMEDGTITSKCSTFMENGKRNIEFQLSISMDERFYQLCLDMALQNLISEENGVTGNGERNSSSGKTGGEKTPADPEKSGQKGRKGRK